MKRVIVMAALAAMAGAAAGQDGTVIYLGQAGAGLGNGGPFNFRANSDIAGTGIKAGQEFQTFCIELGQTVSNTNPKNVRVNDGAVSGSTPPGADTDGDAFNGKDVISGRTAYLFTQFWNGNLDVSTSDKQRGLQLAFWYIEEDAGDYDGSSFDWTGPGGTNAAQEAAALGFLQLADANLAGWGGEGFLGKVRALNIGAGPNYTEQDMLIMIPLPGATAMAGLGLLAVGARRRRSIA